MSRLAWMCAASVVCLLPFLAAPTLAAATPAAAKPAAAGPYVNTDFERCRTGVNVDACYDAIRWRPSDPSLLLSLGDALLRANRPKDALRTYQRVAALAPNTPGVVAKISEVEAKLSTKPARANAAGHAAAADAKRYSNAAPETQSH